MKGIYFEEKGIELLGKLGVTKAEFARRMGIQRQNVNALFKTNNLEIIARASKVLDVPLALLVGDTTEERRERNRLIRQFYYQWMDRNESRKVFNKSLNDYIHIKYISVNETAGHASLRYLSTLAVLQLDAILPNAVLREKKAIKRGTKNQKGFSSMLIMEYYCPAIGLVRLTVGQKRNDGAKVQYCITAIEVP